MGLSGVGTGAGVARGTPGKGASRHLPRSGLDWSPGLSRAFKLGAGAASGRRRFPGVASRGRARTGQESRPLEKAPGWGRLGALGRVVEGEARRSWTWGLPPAPGVRAEETRAEMELEQAADGDVVRGHLPGFGKTLPIGRPIGWGSCCRIGWGGIPIQTHLFQGLYSVPLWGSSSLLWEALNWEIRWD